MKTPLRILIIEDSTDDAELLLLALQRSGFDPQFERVDTPEAMQAALEQERWDIAISDYVMPRFSGLEALRLLKRSGIDLPFIMISGKMGEDTAVEAMKAGAHDYIIKSNLKRLGPTVERELREAKERRERKRAEAALDQRATQLALINDIGSKVAAVLELDTLLNRAARLVQERFDYHHVALFLMEGEALRLKAIAGSYQTSFPAGHRQRLSEGINGWVATHGEKVVANDVHTEARYTSLIAEYTVTQAELCLPIKAAGQTLGVLDIQSPHLNAFSHNDIIALETLTDQIAVAIENARLYEQAQQEIIERKKAEEEIRRRNRDLILLNRVIAASAAGLEPEAVLETACRELALTFDVPQTTATLVNEGEAAAVVVAEYLAEGRPAALGKIIPVSGNPLFEYLLTRKAPLVVEDVQNVPHLAPIHDLMRRRGIVSLLILPLIIEGEVIGSLSLDAIEPRLFSNQEVNLAWSVADQVAGALARTRLTQTRQLLFAAIEQSAESVVITDIEGTMLYVNPTFEQVSGYSRAEVIGQNPRILKSGKQEPLFYRQMWAALVAGEVWCGHIINKKKDGTLFTEDVTISPVRDESGAITNYVAVKRDITRELELEEQYRQAQKMESIGRLAGGVAHDFNNILTVIIGHSELLLRHFLDPQDRVGRRIKDIKEAGERAATLTHQLLAFSRQQTLQPQVLNLNDLVINLKQMLRPLVGEDIELITILDPALAQVKTDPAQIEQIIMNLVVNARDAMPRGGKLTIETANVNLNRNYAGQHFELLPGPYVRLTVTDIGLGMPEDTLARIFEPFFTTKKTGKGTGLGLATVHGIVRQSGGHISVESELGEGTSFKIYLPQVEENVEVLYPLPTLTTSPQGTETILLVEDEAAVRLVTSNMLQQQGYSVLEACNAEEALQIYRQHQGSIDLLITDVIMPGLSGRELAEGLTGLHSPLKVLYISGYTDEILNQHGVLAPDVIVLQKPFSSATLAHKVRQVLS